MKCAEIAPDPPRSATDAIRMRHRHRVLIEARGFGKAVLLCRIHLHDDRGNRHLDRRHGNFVGVGEVFKLLQITARIQVHRQRRHRSHAHDLCGISCSVPKHEERGGPAAMKSTAPESRASFIAEGPPSSIQLHLEVGKPRFVSVLLDKFVLFHHQQRQEPHAASPARNSNFCDLRPVGLAGARGQNDEGA